MLVLGEMKIKMMRTEGGRRYAKASSSRLERACTRQGGTGSTEGKARILSPSPLTGCKIPSRILCRLRAPICLSPSPSAHRAAHRYIRLSRLGISPPPRRIRASVASGMRNTRGLRRCLRGGKRSSAQKEGICTSQAVVLERSSARRAPVGVREHATFLWPGKEPRRTGTRERGDEEGKEIRATARTHRPCTAHDRGGSAPRGGYAGGRGAGRGGEGMRDARACRGPSCGCASLGAAILDEGTGRSARLECGGEGRGEPPARNPCVSGVARLRVSYTELEEDDDGVGKGKRGGFAGRVARRSTRRGGEGMKGHGRAHLGLGLVLVLVVVLTTPRRCRLAAQDVSVEPRGIGIAASSRGPRPRPTAPPVSRRATPSSPTLHPTSMRIRACATIAFVDVRGYGTAPPRHPYGDSFHSLSPPQRVDTRHRDPNLHPGESKMKMRGGEERRRRKSLGWARSPCVRVTTNFWLATRAPIVPGVGGSCASAPYAHVRHAAQANKAFGRWTRSGGGGEAEVAKSGSMSEDGEETASDRTCLLFGGGYATAAESRYAEKAETCFLPHIVSNFDVA
ncbi:hypothetical protein K438DRAFT_1764910 [Mycena galopus ATCC 62051]|nr:hypothetical protein K438DRAFT_1764910 [Mycena galopus ATCC 62051]